MATDVKAKYRFCRVSPQKARLVINLVRGKPVVEAISTLKFVQKSAARHLRQLLLSAVSNAEENFGLNRENLYIHYLVADEAPTRKWRRFGARGRFKPILRRSSHISIVLRDQA